MVDSFIAQMQSFFEDALIIKVKARTFNTQNSIHFEDLNIFYDLIVQSTYPFRVNYLACDLYYQSLKFASARDVFYKYIEKRIKLDDPINDHNMFLIFNIIEFLITFI